MEIGPEIVYRFDEEIDWIKEFRFAKYDPKTGSITWNYTNRISPEKVDINRTGVPDIDEDSIEQQKDISGFITEQIEKYKKQQSQE